MAPLGASHADLDRTLAEAWRLLTLGAADRASPMNVLAVATVGLDGRPRVRSVILRAADPGLRRLRFYCDNRSEKAKELAADPRVALLGVALPSATQIRIEG